MMAGKLGNTGQNPAVEVNTTESNSNSAGAMNALHGRDCTDNEPDEKGMA